MINAHCFRVPSFARISDLSHAPWFCGGIDIGWHLSLISISAWMMYKYIHTHGTRAASSWAMRTHPKFVLTICWKHVFMGQTKRSKIHRHMVIFMLYEYVHKCTIRTENMVGVFFFIKCIIIYWSFFFYLRNIERYNTNKYLSYIKKKCFFFTNFKI